MKRDEYSKWSVRTSYSMDLYLLQGINHDDLQIIQFLLF